MIEGSTRCGARSGRGCGLPSFRVGIPTQDLVGIGQTARKRAQAVVDGEAEELPRSFIDCQVARGSCGLRGVSMAHLELAEFGKNAVGGASARHPRSLPAEARHEAGVIGGNSRQGQGIGTAILGEGQVLAALATGGAGENDVSLGIKRERGRGIIARPAAGLGMLEGQVRGETCQEDIRATDSGELLCRRIRIATA